ncbi:phage tail tape measure protein [bacterium]|nr:phage tail tape measure protein [bacterium]
MLESDMKVSMTLIAFDKMSRVIRDAVGKSNEQFDKMKNKLQDLSRDMEKIGKSATVMGGIALGVSAANLKMAADFEKQMANVSTLIDTNVENFSAMKDEVLEIAKRTPVALDGLTSALYDIRSAGISADMQFKVLEKSAQLGMTGLGSTSEAVDLVTSSLNAFQLKGEKAEKVYDTIFKTVKFGKTTISGIAQGFGSVAGTVAAAGIELDDYLAAVAALTTTGQPAAQAHHQLKAAIAGMTRESDDAKKVFQQLGVHSFKELIQKSGGMVNAFNAIAEKVKGNDSAILSLFGSTMAFNAVMGLTTKQSQAYVDTLESMRNGASLIDEGYQKQLNTEHAQMQRLKNLTQTVAIELGEALAPAFRKVIDFAQMLVNWFSKLPKGIKSFIATGTAGFGILATGIGIACLAGSKLITFYGDLIGYARRLTPFLVDNTVKLLQFMGLNSTAQSVSGGFNLFKAGNKVNLGGIGMNLKNDVFNNIKALDNKLRDGIVRSFKELPSNIAKSASALKDWTVNSIKAIPSNFMAGLNGLKSAFLGIPGMIKNAIISFRTFSVTLLTSPIGWIALAIGAVAFLIYKYWKPITAFFKGVWKGLKEGMQPLMPVFKQIVEALQPIIKPVKAIIEWFKKLIKPVEDTGGAAEAMGVKFGKAIADIILKVAKLVAKIFEFGQKIGDMLAKGIRSKKKDTEGAINEHAQIIRDHLPHSPAKVGPLKDLNKLKIIETIVSTMKPAPLINAMNKNLGLMVSGMKTSGKIGVGVGSSSFVINYSPTISMPNGANKEEFVKLLKQHKDEVVSLFKRELERRERLAY